MKLRYLLLTFVLGALVGIALSLPVWDVTPSSFMK